MPNEKVLDMTLDQLARAMLRDYGRAYMAAVHNQDIEWSARVNAQRDKLVPLIVEGIKASRREAYVEQATTTTQNM